MFTFVGDVLISKEIAHMRVPGNFILFKICLILSYRIGLICFSIFSVCVIFLLHFISLKVFMTYNILSLVRGKMSDKMCSTCQE